MRMSDWSSDVCSSDLCSISPCSGEFHRLCKCSLRLAACKGAQRINSALAIMTGAGQRIGYCTAFLQERRSMGQIVVTGKVSGDSFAPELLFLFISASIGKDDRYRHLDVADIVPCILAPGLFIHALLEGSFHQFKA